MKNVPIITFVGLSGTGKTTFLEKLIPVLKARGYRLAVIKHDAHHFEMDKPGKDTWRFTRAGADVVAISNREKCAILERPPAELSLEELVERLPEVDLVLTEGYKYGSHPKIEIHRAALDRPLLTPAARLLCVMTDEPLAVDAPQLDLEDAAGCADRIEAYLRSWPRNRWEPGEPILVSACLLGARCKYSGGDNLCPEVLALGGKYRLVPVCPEQLGGLPTPRPPAERQGDRVVDRNGTDVTAQFRRGAAEALGLAEALGCRRAVLKARSPSCGHGSLYDGSFSGRLVPGEGVTAEALLAAGLAVYTEEDLAGGDGNRRFFLDGGEKT